MPIGFDRICRACLICVSLFLLRLGNLSASAQIPVQKVQLFTRWAADVSATNAHPEYPRPGMVRSNWMNLNGLWDYAVTPSTATNSGIYSGQILVPFPVESVLSGTNHHFVNELQRLWYHRVFSIPGGWRGERILLHFEASDWETRVWVNGKELGTHQGGYDRFSFDITDAVKPKGEQELVVSVFNPGETGFQPRGKQLFHLRSPFYTASSGIWQTVWLESVPKTYIESLKLVPDIDAGAVRITVLVGGKTNDMTVEVVAFDGENKVGADKSRPGQEFQLVVPNAKLWSPDNPFLYGLKVILLRKGKAVDTVSSYFGMRKISVAKDAKGFPRLMLNNRQLFQYGPLDQGYWPDGIYTAPTDEALRQDIETMKEFGFNMCRKHVKVEPERWYYWCDKLGLLVWQDMPNGARPATAQQHEIPRSAESARQFELELNRMIQGRGNHPCIVMWIPFNQGWGQYDTVRLTGLVKQLDPSRLVAGVTGWFDMGGGDVRSLHAYPGPAKPEYDGIRACVVGECGGLGEAISGHMWGGIGVWSTVYFPSRKRFNEAYIEFVGKLATFKDENGLAGAVITQFTDVETDLNGFMTYDRAVIKMPLETVRMLNKELVKAQGEAPENSTDAHPAPTKEAP